MSKRYKWINGETYCDSDQMYDNETGNKTQPVYVADLLNEQDQKIKDLEAKLEEIQNQTAIRELKKLKEIAYQSATDISLLLDYTELVKIIDNQIKELGGIENVF